MTTEATWLTLGVKNTTMGIPVIRNLKQDLRDGPHVGNWIWNKKAVVTCLFFSFITLLVFASFQNNTGKETLSPLMQPLFKYAQQSSKMPSHHFKPSSMKSLLLGSGSRPVTSFDRQRASSSLSSYLPYNKLDPGFDDARFIGDEQGERNPNKKLFNSRDVEHLSEKKMCQSNSFENSTTISEETGSIQNAQRQDRFEAPPQSSRKVLLVTYGRTGSSFISNLIAAHPDVFYIFEPLYSVAKDGSYSRASLEKWKEAAVRTMNSTFACDFDNKEVLRMIHPWQKSWVIDELPLNDVQQCIRNKHNERCVAWLLSQALLCLARPMTFAKTIRFRLSWARELLIHHYDLKIIFLVRDPRAMLYSHSRVFHTFPWTGAAVKSQAEEKCDILKEDLSQLREIMSLFPGRIKAVRYEDAAINSMEFLKEMYNFLNLKVTQAVTELTWITTHTASDDSFSTFRQSRVSMDQWRNSIGLRNAQIIDNACGRLYQTLGYRRASSAETLTDPKISLTVPPKDRKIFTSSLVHDHS